MPVVNPRRTNAMCVPESELCLYRAQTKALLRRYLRLSLEVGRVPSVLGKEFFRAQAASYRLHTFEDTVIFVHDVECCLACLDEFSQQLIARTVLQEYSQIEAAVLLGCSRRTVSRRLADTLDELSAIFLGRELLRPLGAGGQKQSRCQGGEIEINAVICTSAAT